MRSENIYSKLLVTGKKVKRSGLIRTLLLAGILLFSVPAFSQTVTSLPMDANACAGDNVSFTVAADPNVSGDPLTYQWQVSTDLTTFTDVPGATDATFTISSVPIGDNGNFYAVTVSETGAFSGSVNTFTDGGEFANLTVNPAPSPIAGTSIVCPGAMTTLTDADGGGLWTSDNSGIATVDGTSGAIVGVTGGTTTISYILSGCSSSTIVTVNPLPDAISGTLSVCAGSTTTLSDAGGGTWSISDASIATVNSSGVVSGVAIGTIPVTYTLPTGCQITAIVTVNPLPSAITGTRNACVGATSHLSDPDGGGTWMSSNTGVATVGSTGIVTGVLSGTTSITYTLPTGCAISTVFTVNTSPDPITGTASMCAGATTTLSDGGGGTWSSLNTGVATVFAGTGVVNGVTAGTATIVYTLTGCTTNVVVTVNPMPGAIGGTKNVCIGLTTALSDAGGGTWVSGTTSVATVDGSGVVTGVTAGTSTIIYTLPTGCATSTVVTVNSVPGTITGTPSVCAGSTTNLGDPTPFGNWTSSNTSVATVGSGTGTVGGLIAGTSTISYSLSIGCTATVVVTVNPLPTSITGITNICSTASTTLSYSDGAGTWSSGNTGVATIGSTDGVVTGVISGTATISYTLASGCGIATTVVTVNSPVASIGGNFIVCGTSSTTLTDATTGGTWSSSNGGAININSTSGAVTGVAPGTSTITYTVAGAGCTVIQVVTDNVTPVISGTFTVCGTSTTTLSLSAGATGGTWMSSNTATANIGISSGTITGVAPGTSTITYTASGTGCTATQVITDNTTPAITGTLIVCGTSASSLSLSAGVSGGTWSSSNTGAANIGLTTGIVTGVAPGTSTITYTTPGAGCTATSDVTDNATPAISGTFVVCGTSTTPLTLSAGVAGGTWTSSNIGVANIGLSTGIVAGAGPGTSTITYTTDGSGCTATQVITDNTTPAITGTMIVCGTSTTTLSLSAGIAGGTWSSSNTGAANIDVSSGIVTGVAPGTSTITYTTPGAGCMATSVVTDNATPVIAGTFIVCGTSTTALSISAGVSGGTWSSSNTGAANVDVSSGIVTGVAPGTSTITYTTPGGGCTATQIVTDNVTPVISGTFIVCGTSATTLSLSVGVAGGTWSSSNTGAANVDVSLGIVTGVAPGTSTITYTTTGGGCAATQIVTDNTTPAISGTALVCGTSTTTLSLSAGVAGGTWTSGNTAAANVGLTTGVVTGVAPGTSTITYTTPGAGCTATQDVTDNVTPVISGTFIVCGTSTSALSLSAGVAGGTWSSSNTGAANIDVSSGIVTGVAPGTSTITYTTTGGGCTATQVVTDNTTPVISGTAIVCGTSTTTLSLSAGVAGGTWTSGNTAAANIDISSGLVSGVAPGTSTITYTTTGAGCTATQIVTDNVTPVISGTFIVCGTSTSAMSLSAGVSGGTWSSSNTGAANIDVSSGIVTGVAPGTSTITYTTTGGGCTATQIVTDNTTPVITGTAIVCGTSTTTLSLSAGIGGGTWSSSNTGAAGIDVSSGMVTGVAPGTTTITYTTPGAGCTATLVVTDNAVPAISGTFIVCGTSSTTLSLSAGASGGTWTSSNTGAANVGLSTGTVTGVAPGTSTITYTASGSGCTATHDVTDNVTPVISGSFNVCGTSTTTLSLSAGVSGGTWTSSNLAAFTINSTTGDVTGVAPGTSTITYTTPGAGCTATQVVTDNPSPVISGTFIVCGTSSTTLSLSAGATGGTWVSSNTSAADIDLSSGVLTGVAPGTSTITYNVGVGCTATQIVTVNEVPDIVGVMIVCGTTSTTLSLDAGISGGTWTSSNTSALTIGISSGTITGVAPGTSTITYITPGAGCTAIAMETDNPVPVISGTFTVCGTSSTTLSLSVGSPGGFWVSGNTSALTIDAFTATVTGVAPGTSTITYLGTGAGCIAQQDVTDNATPAISGSFIVCGTSSTTLSLSAGATGGTWTSSNTSAFDINSTTGAVTGVAPGTSTITYTSPGAGCSATQIITDNATPAITGSFVVCGTSTTTLTLSAGLTGGTWISSNTGAVNIDIASGAMTGVAPGTSTITYTNPGVGCTATQVVTDNATPVIAGSLTLCNGSSTTLSLSAGVSGGTWTSSTTGVATIGSTSGVVAGAGPGTSTITYTTPGTGCTATAVVSINSAPGTISGTLSVCGTLTSTLTDGLTGGTWTSSTLSVATVGSTNGVVKGVTPGTTTITYTVPSGCFTTSIFTVNPAPTFISPPAPTKICVGLATTLTDASTGGTWNSTITSVATVGTSVGTVTGVAPGTTTIVYTLPGGCFSSKVVTVNALPATIGGTLNVCVSSTTSLSEGVGGTWTSSTTSVATVGSGTGVVSGVLAGTTTITFTATATTCATSSVVTVNPLPGSISGTMTVCVGAVTTLTDAGGGTWSSVSSHVSVNSTTGDITGVSAGNATIVYTLPTGCTTSTIVTVNPAPSPITGTAVVCQGLLTTLSDAGGGTWTSNPTSVATVDASGNVGGVSGGTATISYTLPVTGCVAKQIVTVNPSPNTITAPNAGQICIGFAITLTDAGGGTWSSGDASIGVNATTGDITGITAGTATVTYTLPTGCITSTVVTINPQPAAITGTMNVCSGSTTTLSDAGGGTWTSSDLTVASIDASGLVTGANPGTTTITYTLATGCSTTTTVVVNPLPGTITGTAQLCDNSTTSLTDGTPFGSWSSSNTAVATVGSGTGTVFGVSAGTAIISYALGTGCQSTIIVTVNPSVPAPISGTLSLCNGSTSPLSDATGTGTWSSSAPSVATVGSLSGIVSAVAPGTSDITYTLSTGCGSTTATVTVNTISVSPSNNSPACINGTVDLFSGESGTATGVTYSWSGPDLFVSGLSDPILSSATALMAGTYTVTASVPGAACSATGTTTVTINPVPVISGNFVVCGTSTSALSLSAGVAGGTWTSSNTDAVNIDISSGLVTGVAPGTSTITYTTAGSGCSATQIVTDNATPAIAGTFVICGTSTSALSLSAGIAGGTWSSSNTGAANIDISSGIVTGVAPGTSTITYTTPGVGCSATQVVTDNTTPAITGTLIVCGTSSTTLSLSAGVTGGTWSSSNTGAANIDISSGLLTGVAPGTSTITYTTSGAGCTATQDVTDNSTPAITGTFIVCGTSTSALSLSAGVAGGTWSSSNTGAVDIDISSGIVTGVAPGTSTITYTTPGAGCTATQDVTDNTTPAITGTFIVCETSTSALSLSAGVTGGTWISSNTGAVNIDISSGIVTGVAPGTSTITYTTPGNGCTATQIATDNVTPVISGTFTVCGTTSNALSLSAGIAGGSWTSSNTSALTINSTTGVVTGVAPGTSTVTYTTPGSGCSATQVVTDVAFPVVPAITGNTTLSTAITTTLSDLTTGGVWLSVTTSVATVGSSSGVVSGVTAGTDVISYTVTTSGCATTVTTNVTVNNPATALNFDGDDDQVIIPNSISGGSFTIEYWVKTTQTAGAGAQWYNGNGLVDAEVGGVTEDFGTSLVGSKFAFGIGDPDVTIMSSSDINTGNWTHVAATWDQVTGEMILYINGIQESTTVNAGGPRTAPPRITIGSIQTDGGFFNGTIDEVRLWNTVRTQAQIQANMNCDIAQDPTLVAYYRLEDGAADGTNTGIVTATDYSGNGNCGVLNNFALDGSASNYVTGAVGSCNTITIPTAAPTNNSPICNGGSVTLTAHPGGGATSYAWTDGAGFTSTLQNPTPSPTTGTTYSVTPSNIFGAGCTSTTVVTVNPTPLAAPTNSGTICAGGNATLTANSTDATAWSWTGSDATTSTLQNPVFTLTTTTTYSLTVSSGGAPGCSPSTIYTTTVTVNPVPTATPTNNGPICLGTTVTLTANAVGGVGAYNYTWSGAGITGSTTDSVTTAVPISVGTTVYSLTVTDTASGCSSGLAYTTSVSVNPTPAAAPSNSGNICAGAIVGLFANSTNTTAWAWTGSNGFTSTLEDPSDTPTTTTTYTLTVSSPGLGCSSILLYTTTVTVNPTPTAAPTNDGPICVGGTVNLASHPSGSVTTYAWSGVSITSSTTSMDVVATPIVTNTYSLTVTDGSGWPGCSSSYTIPVTVKAVPTATPTNDGPICNGGTVNLSANPGGSTTTYLWSGTFLSSTLVQNPTATPTVTTTYSLTVSSPGSGCSPTTIYTTTVTVNPIPTAAPTNDGPICNGGTVNLDAHGTGSTATYAWSGADLSATTIATPSATPSVTSTYTLTVTDGSGLAGCNSTYVTTVSVNPTPTAAPTNSGPICNTGTVTLNANSTAATIWSWNGPDGFVSGTQNPIATPSVTGTYTLTVSSGSASGCSPVTTYTTSVTVVPTPTAAPTNDGLICVGGIVNLAAHPGGSTSTYLWTGPFVSTTSAANPTAVPTVTSTYSLTVTNGTTWSGCTSNYSTVVTVDSTPTAAPSNDGPICGGGTVDLMANGSGSTTTYLWAGPNLTSNTIAAPSATLTVSAVYTLTVTNGTSGSGCSTSYTNTVIVSLTPIAAPTNSGPICNGGTVNLFAHGGGSTSAYLWSGPNLSSNTIADPTATPTVTTTYSLTVNNGTGSGCSPTTIYTTTVVVNPTPTASPSNDGPICAGGTVNLLANPGGGTSVYAWSGPALSSSTAQNPTATPTVTSTYSLTVTDGSGSSGCSLDYTTTVSVNPVPVSTGLTNDGPLCAGGTVNLSGNTNSSTTGWMWTGPNLSSSTIQNTTATPTTTATYSLTVVGTGDGCTNDTVYTTTVTVNDVPTAAPTNSGPICNGGMATLNSVASGGTGTLLYSWSGPNLSSSTDANPTATPTITSTYSLTVTSTGSGCNPTTVYTTTVTVNSVPTSTGVTNDGPICNGGTVNLSSHTSGGTGTLLYAWSGPNLSSSTDANPTATPTVNSTYSLTVSSTGSGCNPATVYTTAVTVNSVPTSTGATNDGPICNGGIVNLSSHASGGTGVLIYSWSGPNLSSSTDVNPTATPTITSTYSLTVSSTGAGCNPATVYTTTVTVNDVPTSTGATNDGPICNGGVVNLSSHASGGTGVLLYSWSGPNLSSSTEVNPTATPTTTSTYSLTVSSTGAGCSPGITYTTTVTVNSVPTAAPNNDGPICIGGTANLNANATGGTGVLIYAWSGPNLSSSTIATPTATPTITSTYSVTVSSTGAGCNPGTVTVTTVTVKPVVAPITGVFSVCGTNSTTLADATTGGTWSSSLTPIATIGSNSGTVTGVSGGTTTISYATAGSGCLSTQTFTVNPVSAISGTFIVCGTSSTTLTDAATGGTWTSSNTSAAVIGSISGMLTGVAPGTTTITYNLPTGCSASQIVTVNTVPFGIRPLGSSGLGVCAGATISLTDVGSGTWSSSNMPVATIGSSSGIVTGVLPGTTTITYTMPGVGCSNAAIVTVNTMPVAISGPSSLCANGATTLTDATTGGRWTSSVTSVATVGSSSSTTAGVHGVGAGTTIISYTLISGCGVTYTETVNPAPFGIRSNTPLCAGTSITLVDAGGGTWISNNTALASIGLPTGIMVAGGSAGNPVITYTLPTGCFVTTTVTVTTTSSAITGASTVAVAATIPLANPIVGGTWFSTNTGVATINSIGTVTGVSVGTTTISYTVACGTNTKVISVTAHRDAEPGTGIVPAISASDIRVTPNPNKGTFTIKGNLAVAEDDEVSIEITDMLGQVIYNNKVIAAKGVIDQKIQLNSSIANGMYILSVHTSSESNVFHVVIEQ